jgi:RNA polymerase sigma factor (sigma-70 family)
MSDSPQRSPAGGPTKAADAATQVFIEHRELLFSIVYNLLGSVADTQDVLQETWLSWAPRSQAPGAEPIDNPRGYLVRVAVNQALARQAAIKRQRETYIGPWLPEPLVTSVDPAEHAAHVESVSIALLVVLETLSPLERAVFVLHEVFGYGHSEIAGILGRSPAAIRQLGHRAREHVHARRPRFPADPHLQQKVTQRFITAAVDGDLETLLELLAPEVTFFADSGGKLPKAALRPVYGRDNVARVFIGLAARPPERLDVRYGRANGDPSALLFVGGIPYAVLVLDLNAQGDQVRNVYVIGSPDKLSHLNQQPQEHQEDS